MSYSKLLKRLMSQNQGVRCAIMVIVLVFALVYLLLSTFHLFESKRELQERLGADSFTLPSLEAITSTEMMPLIMTPFTNFATLNKKAEASHLMDLQGKKKTRQWRNEDLRGMRKCPSSSLFSFSGKGRGEEDVCWNAAMEDYVERWRVGKEVNKLCEPEALSAIHCHDSPPTSYELYEAGVGGEGKRKRPTRFCEFSNAMMNFKKMRTLWIL